MPQNYDHCRKNNHFFILDVLVISFFFSFSTVLRSCLQKVSSVASAEFHCNAQTKPHHVLQKLMSLCAIIGAQNGRILRPKEHDHLVFYLRDLSLPKPDKWGTSQLLAWLQQVIVSL